MKPTLKIAIIGEGKNDVGVLGEKEWNKGTVQEYLRRLLDDKFTLEFEPLSVSKAETKNIRTLKGGRYRKYKIRGVAKKLLRFVEIHKNNDDLKVLIFFSDTDKTQGERASEHEARRKYASVLSDIQEGQQLISDEMPNLIFISMIPVRILECWLLGDKDGFENIGFTPEPNLPINPEFLWGDQSNPESNYPKHYLKRVLENGGWQDSTETYKLIIDNNDFENLSKNCSLSFKPFYEEIIALKERLTKEL